MDSTTIVSSGIRALRSWTTVPTSVEQDPRMDRLEYRVSTMENRQRHLSQKMDEMSRLLMEVAEILTADEATEIPENDPMETEVVFDSHEKLVYDEYRSCDDELEGLSENKHFDFNPVVTNGVEIKVFDELHEGGQAHVFDDLFDELTEGEETPVYDELADETPVYDEWLEAGEVHVSLMCDVFDKEGCSGKEHVGKEECCKKSIQKIEDFGAENLPLLNVESENQALNVGAENQALNVADGGKMECNTLCPDFAWDVQGYKFEAGVRRVSEFNSSPVETDARLQPVPTHLAQVFEEPNTLPPVRSHAHEIPLKEGVEPFKCGELLLLPPEPPPQRFHDLVLTRVTQGQK